ncbi:methionine/alanine import family NSS transporter small subunit [Leucobacter ruminantium]|uniref:Methionine/alanine import family NSS transporter small subunit n=1 Tax=Leucobacter ruminantium TaxID=1289170 RepID=A0A939LT11_9MICO|nr:methionine/alanine import family NSS transporter small subunit [Leucobacter ruminantium]MBO1803832.1 methionine/alanine import family NSS transporter small subunit [Leucobacter ruminantium]
MTPIAIVFLVLAAAVVWGGLVVSGIFLGRRPEVDEYPPGGDDPAGEEVYDLPPIRDT